MTLVRASNLCVGDVLEITFPTFRPRITLKPEHALTVEIVAGDNAGFSDTLSNMRRSPFAMALSFFHGRSIGSTIVHVLDLLVNQAHTFVTPARGGFMRLIGPVERKGAP